MWHRVVVFLAACLLPAMGWAFTGGPGPGGYSWFDHTELINNPDPSDFVCLNDPHFQVDDGNPLTRDDSPFCDGLSASNAVEQGTEIWIGSDLDDSFVWGIPLGFDFEFYGVMYNQIGVSSNGFLAFDDLSPSSYCCAVSNFPDAALPNNIIALWWGDLNPSRGTGGV